MSMWMLNCYPDHRHYPRISYEFIQFIQFRASGDLKAALKDCCAFLAVLEALGDVGIQWDSKLGYPPVSTSQTATQGTIGNHREPHEWHPLPRIYGFSSQD